jgi:hypothetical protein
LGLRGVGGFFFFMTGAGAGFMVFSGVLWEEGISRFVHRMRSGGRIAMTAQQLSIWNRIHSKIQSKRYKWDEGFFSY